MTTRETAEAAVYRSAAVRDLMATGATRAEAEAAVSEEVALRLHADLGPAVAELGRVMGRAFAAAVEGLNEAARQLGAALARAHAGRVPPWQVPAGQRRRDYGLVR